MRDPFSWSLPLGRLFGITIRLHVLFPLVVAAVLLRVAFAKDASGNFVNPDGFWIEAAWLMLILFFSVLLHELGHCFAARWMDGEASEVLLWPLGGLASVDVPHTPKANFIVAAAGPAVNLMICLASAAGLAAYSLSPGYLMNPFHEAPFAPTLYNWSLHSHQALVPLGVGPVLLARIFWVNWILALLNLVLVGFPMDMGRMLQCALWPRFGFRQATLAAVFAGFITALVVGIYSVVMSDMLFVFLCLFIYVTCRQQWINLETGGEDSLFGYDFSQGYTSLERDQPPVRRRRRPGFWQRWLQRRQERRRQREQEEREAEERRVDELLQKVHREGKQALTTEELRFLTRVSARFRNQQ